MADLTGVVQAVNIKDISGGRKSYDIVIGGQAYGAGLFAPKCKVGDYVKFEIDDSRGYKNVARNSLKVSANKPPAEALAEAAATAGAASSAGGAGGDKRQDTISRQAASNTAIEFLKLLSANEALGLPAATSKGKRQEVLEQLLLQYTVEFYENNTGVEWKSIAPNAATNEDKAEEEVAEPEDAAWS